MATSDREVDLTGLRDPQRPVAYLVGVVLIVVGVAGLSGILDFDSALVGGLGSGLLLGLFGIPVWLGVTAIVGGLIGVVLAGYGGGATTFNKVAAGLVFPPVLFLAVTDVALATGGIPVLVLGLVSLLLAVVFVVVWLVLFVGHPLMVVHPVVAILAIADWALDLSAMVPASEPATLPTVALLLVLAVVVGAIGFEGGSRLT